MPRLLILSNSPTPNNDALFAALHRQPGTVLRVLYCAWLEPHRLWALDRAKGYDYEVALGLSIGTTHVNPGIARHIRRFHPDVAILTGSYTMPTFLLAVRELERSGIPWAYWGEELSFDRRSPLASSLRAQLRGVLRRAALVLAIGSRARASYARLGIPSERIVDFRYYADVAHFQLPVATAAAARAEHRAAWGASADVPVFLYCGQLIPRKSVDTLIRAAALLAADGVDLRVVLAGDGDERDALRALATQLRVVDRLHFTGFVQPRLLPQCFAAADALVLPSLQEGWGLVVPEALAAGLPVIASDRVNAAADLVVDGTSGFHFSAGDAAGLAAAMRALLVARGAFRDEGHDERQDAPVESRDLGAAARAAVREETPAHAAARLTTLLAPLAANRPAARHG